MPRSPRSRVLAAARWSLRWTLGLLGAGALAGEPEARDLAGRLHRALLAPEPSSVCWGAVVTRGDGSLIFATNAHGGFIPASNTKLFVGAMALDLLGSEARLRTPLQVDQPPDPEGVLRSDLWVLGQGDPTIGPPPRPGQGEPQGTRDDALVPRVARWQSKGLRRIDGDLVVCEAALRVPEYGPGWDDEDRAEDYGAPVSAFVVNDNTFRLTAPAIPKDASDTTFRIDPPLPSIAVDWQVTPGTNTTHRIQYLRRGPGRPVEVRGRLARGIPGWSADLAVANPAMAFGELLRRTLERRGIRVSGAVRVASRSEAIPPVVWDHWTSEPLARRLGLCLKPSQNLHAQLLLAEVGRQAELRDEAQATTRPAGKPAAADTPARRHDEWGLAQLPGFLARAGIHANDVRLEEGSGLSRSNRVTPASTVALLRFMASHAEAGAWKESLPVAGVDGTLRHRFRSGPARGNVRAKTGSLRGVHALGGYVRTAGGEDWIFAVYANQAEEDAGARSRMDRFVEILAGAGAPGGSSNPGSTPPR